MSICGSRCTLAGLALQEMKLSSARIQHQISAVLITSRVSLRFSRQVQRPRLPQSIAVTRQRRLPAAIRQYSTSDHVSSTQDHIVLDDPRPVTIKGRSLPKTCPGCGALSQDQLRHEAGYYSADRKTVQDYTSEVSFNELQSTDLNISELQKSNDTDAAISQIQSLTTSSIKAPYCDRCHDLNHHNKGLAIAHPSLADLELTINESPHDENHIWHVLDAADFPMSLVLDLDKRLSNAYLRPRNRRSKESKYVGGRKGHMNFIITRSDLLAPKKEMVDRMMPKLQAILRTALGQNGEQTRLGNVHVVSADRGWWTKSIKTRLLHESGAHWLVGKVNVGKSKLFETVFPKGTNKRLGTSKQDDLTSLPEPNVMVSVRSEDRSEQASIASQASNNTFQMLSPVQPAAQYPVMPIISKLAGTTVSPIRIPFFDGKCELIDLPGLRRGGLEEFVELPQRKSLIMTDRVAPTKIVIKPGQSLLLGGLIRLTPTQGSPIIMAHAFTPLETHLTSNSKAEAIHTGQIQPSSVGNITLPEARLQMQSSGTFKLSDDVTRVYAGPLTRRDAVGLKPERLPFSIVATDILIEGIGWVELQAQVRKPKSWDVQRRMLPLQHSAPDQSSAHDDVTEDWNMQYPEVEVFSPLGKFVGQRHSLCAFSQGGSQQRKKTARPRRSMVSVKRQRKPQASPRMT